MKRTWIALIMIATSAPCIAQTMSGVCMISEGLHKDGAPVARVMLSENNCATDGRNCMEMSNTSTEWRQWTGVSPEILHRDTSTIDAKLVGDAGSLTCNGVVHDGILSGRFGFDANPAFVTDMAALGFDGILPRKQLSMLMLDITPAWAKQIQSLGITELNTNRLQGLRALHVDADYIHAMAAAGYPELRAGKLTEMKAVGVTPEKVQEAKSLGFQPSEQDLIQMAVFKIDRPFVERMRARGLTDLTLKKLIQIKIFKLDD
ncbi:hypothetical protein [Terriglobus roseus]|uniref:Uncharacterized protein n=1 Tax=Terriglobus roseus TaxID=392734 RepID=A0A1G7L6Y2_9BACT|nr:hypothetical protein [Terriglobus roseus]SDF45205.1 hypothetical protein SAMN05444167_2454 [Terriglobus roseus]